jgi:long-chain acyl-CoA synthetase
LWDRIVFNKIKMLFGGQVRFMCTGSAPIAGEVLEFLKACFCAPICEGYGMTEGTAAGTATYFHDLEVGHVGGPLQNVKFRLRDIPEMNYLASADPPKGELQFWGPSVMSGYFKNKEKTDEVLKDGWLSSGDVGLINPNGSIKIIDRAKNIFKLSQGEYVAPEKLENVFIQSSWIAQIWIIGDSIRDYVVTFIVVDPDAV